MLDPKNNPLEARNALAPPCSGLVVPFIRFGVIHGDPHLGNYTVFARDGEARLNLLDFGCIRIFPPKFVKGVVELYRALMHGDHEQVVQPTRTGASSGCRAS